MTYRLRLPATSHRNRLRSYLLLTLLLGSAAISAIGALTTVAEELPATSIPKAIIINEIKTGGSSEPKEYVTLYNQSDQAVSLDDWKLEYAKSTFSTADCNTNNWKAINGSAVTAIRLSGIVPGQSVSNTFVVSMNDKASGSVRITDPSGTTTDLLGWGSDTLPAPCRENNQAPLLTNDKSLIRYLGCTSSTPVDSDDNASDFMLNNTPTPGSKNSTSLPTCTPAEEVEEVITNCDGVAISEILPNPAGTDTGHEFIELHNTTGDVINLSSCSLQTSASNKVFALTNIMLQPHEYQSVSDVQSGLTLANSSGGTVWLLDETEELQAITYPANMEDDTSWMFADNQWDISYTPTPGSINVLTSIKPCPEGQVRNIETNRCVAIATIEEELEPCDPGQERNPETNRCRTIVSVASAASCPAGQARNSETNRCRSITTAASNQIICKPGQERNPETNRCRNVTTAAGTSKPCPAGQERNPETNRCRKISAAAGSQNGSGLGGVQDVAADGLPQQSKPYWLIAAVLLLSAIGYAVYEWRQEVRLFAAKQLDRLKSSSRVLVSHVVR